MRTAPMRYTAVTCGNVVGTMSPEDHRDDEPRGSVPTPFYANDECLMMVAESPALRAACVGTAMQLGIHPVVATRGTMLTMAAANRPLVVVIEFDPYMTRTEIMDLAVSIGAQMVEVQLTDTPESLAQRVHNAVIAARHLRAH